ncbi:MAG: acyl-CoA carboxylase subunit beta [Pleomorphochaeta sp.]
MVEQSKYDVFLQKNKIAELGGGIKNIEKQHQKGKYTARERIEMLLDNDSFQEFDKFVLHDCHEFSMDENTYYGDGVVTGVGEINGKPVCVYAQDFTVIGGSLSKMQAAKICKIMDLAINNLMPIIGINDSGGARIQEGIDSLAGYGEIFHRNVKASGLIPQISIILGPCAGGAVYSPAIQDFIIMNKTNSFMFVTGPKVVKDVIHEDVSIEDLGGAKVHSQKSGVAHLVSENEEQALLYAKKLIEFLPSNCQSFAPCYAKSDESYEAKSMKEILPKNNTTPYDMNNIINNFLDKDTFFEIFKDYGKSSIVGFGYLEGQSVGIVANQPNYLAGVLDINASNKISRFVRTCDAYNIPIITFEDVPGFMPGSTQEHGGIIRHGAKVLYAYSEATVPKITFIIRKAYGGAYIVMNSRHLGADYVGAWPNAEIAVMGSSGAAKIIFSKEALEKKNPEKFLKEREETYIESFLNPYRAAQKLYIDEIIDPDETRNKAIKMIKILKKKNRNIFEKKHGNIPL